jgi:ring-1,2-phenylacetyl-CoA epoxidase subunit PaaC
MSTVTESLVIDHAPAQEYLLRLADTLLVHAQRLGEWAGHAPVLEEDIALTNLSLDLLGQARALLTLAGGRMTPPRDEDDLAMWREERDFRNVTLVELPGRKGGRDFGDTVLRNLFVAAWLKVLWQRLEGSSDRELAAIAGKALKECRYHVEHAADWVVRLGDGTDESARRMAQAMAQLAPYVTELFEADAVDAHAQASGLGPSWAELRDPWLAEVGPVLAAARLALPKPGAFRATGRLGRHSEHLGYLLAEMQHLQRTYPGGAW